MKVFLDANVLVSVLNKEYPVYTYSSRILSIADKPGFMLYTSPLCLAIAFYFAEKKSGTALARNKIILLAQKLHITTITPETVDATVMDKRIQDFEDGLQYYSAIDSGCKCIVTEDSDDFYFSEVETLTSRRFMEQYVF